MTACAAAAAGRPATCTTASPKGMGGSSDPERWYGLANLVCLCRRCHGHVHAHPRESYDQGWIVHSWDDPGQVPVGEATPLF